jgi:DinB superfamily
MAAEIDELRQGLVDVRTRLLETIAGVSEEQFKKRPPGEPGTPANWCIAEVLAHLLQQEKLRSARITQALEQDGASVTPGTDEEHFEAARAGRASPVPQLIHGLLASRREVERLLDETGAIEGGLERTTTHPRHGAQSVGWILRAQVIDHEAEHVAQIEAIKAALAEMT